MPLEGVRRRDLDEHGAELPAVLAVGDPVAGSRGVLAGGDTSGAWPISVTRSRSPRTFSRSTQKPLSALWNVTRSTRPESCSSEGSEGAAVMAGWSLCRARSRAGPGS